MMTMNRISLAKPQSAAKRRKECKNLCVPLHIFAPLREKINRLNQLVIENASGEGSRMRFTGTTSGESRVTVAGVDAKKLSNNRFEAWVEMRQGENEIEILAYDTNKVVHTANFKVNVPSTEPQTLSYDADGNLLEDATRKFTWDAKNQLREIEFKDGSGFIEFSYDASGRRVKMVKKDASETVIEEKRYLWVGGNQPYEECFPDVSSGPLSLTCEDARPYHVDTALNISVIFVSSCES